MKYLFLFIASYCATLITSCDVQKTSVMESEKVTQVTFIKQHVAFADARIRSISLVEYVREIVFINFSKENHMQRSIIFKGTTFFDDGSYNDLNPGDGIYTSAAIFNHNENLPFDQSMTIKSVMDKVVIDKQFQHNKELPEALQKYNIAKSKAKIGPRIWVHCDLEFGVGGCKADSWGWCDNCCFSYDNCDGGFEWSFW